MTDAAIPLLLSVAGVGGGDLPRASVTIRDPAATRPSGGGTDMASRRSFSALIAGSDDRVRDGAADMPRSRGPTRGLAGDRPGAPAQATVDAMDPEPLPGLLPMLLQPAPIPSEPQALPARIATEHLDRADGRAGFGASSILVASVDVITGADTLPPSETAAGRTHHSRSGSDALTLAGSVAPNGEIDAPADSQGEPVALAGPDARMVAARGPFAPSDGLKAAAARPEPPSAGSGRSAARGPQTDPGLTTGPSPALLIPAAGNAPQATATVAMRRASGLPASGIGIGIGIGVESLSSAVASRDRGSASTAGATARVTADAVASAATNVPFSFRTNIGAGLESGGGAAGDLRTASMPVAASRPADETVESQSFADVIIGMTDGARLEVELAAADSTAAERLRDELGQLEQELWENGSDVEAIRVELRDAAVAYDRKGPQPGDAVSGPDEEDWRRDEGGIRNDRQEQGGSSDTMDGRGMAGQSDASDARPGRWPNDATSTGVVPGSQARRTSMPGDGASRDTADGKVDRYG